MINVEHIHIAVKIASEEYIKHDSIKTLDNMVSIIDCNKTMFQEVLRLSEQYLTDTITDSQILKASLIWLRDHMKIDEEYLQQVSLVEYIRAANQFN